MTIYSIDLKVAATAYVRANSKEEAIAMLKSEIDENSGSDYFGFQIGGLAADISLSPAMTVWGPFGIWDDMEQSE